MKAVTESNHWWPYNYSIDKTNKLTEGWGIWENVHRERIHAVDSYATTESDKAGGITRLLLFRSENKT